MESSPNSVSINVQIEEIYLRHSFWWFHISLLPIARLRQTFRANLNFDFKAFTVMIPLLWTWVHFRPAFYCGTLLTVSSLMDGGMPAFNVPLFIKTFPISSWNRLICCKVFLFWWKDSFVFLFHLPSDGCFWYFQYDTSSLSCILMQIVSVNGNIQWNSL